MGRPPVRGDNPRALASGLSYVHVDKHGITILYHLHQIDLAHHEIVCAKVGKGGIKAVISAECKELNLIAHGLFVAHSLTHQPDQTDLSLRDK